MQNLKGAYKRTNENNKKDWCSAEFFTQFNWNISCNTKQAIITFDTFSILLSNLLQKKALQGPLSIPISLCLCLCFSLSLSVSLSSLSLSVYACTPQSFLLNFPCLHFGLYCKASLAKLIRGIFPPQ